MPNNFNLVHELSLDNYNIKLYKLASAILEVSLISINNLQSELNSKQYTKDIISLLETQNGISKIEVYDKNNNLLTSSGLLIIEE